MKLTIHDDLLPQVGTGSFHYKTSDYPTPLKFEASVSAGYTELTSSEEWDIYWVYTGVNYKTYRNNIITHFNGSWASLSVAERKVLVHNFCWPATATVGELDACFTSAERFAFKKEVIKGLNNNDCMFKLSSTASSEKYFDLTVNDSGTMNPTELLSTIII